MMCERGGCAGCEGNLVSPIYPFLMVVLFIAAVAAGRYFGFIA